MPVTRRWAPEVRLEHPTCCDHPVLEENRMTETALQVLRDALSLSPIERAELIDGLLHSFDPTPDQWHRDAWKEEAESRIDAFEAGTLTDDTAEAMFDRINRR